MEAKVTKLSRPRSQEDLNNSKRVAKEIITEPKQTQINGKKIETSKTETVNGKENNIITVDLHPMENQPSQIIRTANDNVENEKIIDVEQRREKNYRQLKTRLITRGIKLPFNNITHQRSNKTEATLIQISGLVRETEMLGDIAEVKSMIATAIKDGFGLLTIPYKVVMIPAEELAPETQSIQNNVDSIKLINKEQTSDDMEYHKLGDE